MGKDKLPPVRDPGPADGVLDFRPEQMKYRKAFVNCAVHETFEGHCHPCLHATVVRLTQLLDRVIIDGD